MVAYWRRVNLMRHVLPFERVIHGKLALKYISNKHCVDWIYLDPRRI